MEAAQYAVYGARVGHQRSGRKIALVGHSQGGAMVLWVAKFWPDVARHASDVIPLAAPLRGTTMANTLCVTGRCAPLTWQMRQGSLTMQALEGAAMPEGLAVASIATRMDELITPQPNASSGDGIDTVPVQDVCPGHVAEHGMMLADPVGYAVMIDALIHEGTARVDRIDRIDRIDRVDRIDRGVCATPALPETDPVGAAGFVNAAASFVTGLANPLDWADREPDLPAYAEEADR